MRALETGPGEKEKGIGGTHARLDRQDLRIRTLTAVP